MALIQRGNLQQLANLSAPEPAVLGGDEEVSSRSAGAPPQELVFAQSTQTRGLALKTIRLDEGFQNFLGKVFDSKYDVYFVSWAWDMSGSAPFAHPETGTDPRSILIPMKVGNVREFIGQGVLLHPERKVRGGLAVRIMLWESSADTRELGQSITAVTKAIKESKLTSLLSVLGTVLSVPTATLTTIGAAAVELADVVGTILQGQGDDHVDLYEGYYAAADAWAPSEERYTGNSSEISLSKF